MNLKMEERTNNNQLTKQTRQYNELQNNVTEAQITGANPTQAQQSAISSNNLNDAKKNLDIANGNGSSSSLNNIKESASSMSTNAATQLNNAQATALNAAADKLNEAKNAAEAIKQKAMSALGGLNLGSSTSLVGLISNNPVMSVLSSAAAGVEIMKQAKQALNQVAGLAAKMQAVKNGTSAAEIKKNANIPEMGGSGATMDKVASETSKTAQDTADASSKYTAKTAGIG